MKNLLLTLLALLSIGIMANADNLYPGQYLNDGPTIVYGDIDGNEISEITLNPGESVELSLILKQMNCALISGFGIQWRMYDVDHAPIYYASDAMVKCDKVYGNRTKFWFNPVGIGTNDASQGGYNGVSLAASTPYDNVYRILGVNTAENMIFFDVDENGNPTCPAVFGHFTIKVDESWGQEFATFELDTDYSLFYSCPNYNPDEYWESKIASPQVLTIKNAALETTDFTGEIIIGDLNEETGQIPVRYEGPEEVNLVVTVNGQEVEVAGGKITLPAYGQYEVVATISAEGYNTESLTKSFTWAGTLPAIVPQISFNVDADGVFIVVTDATSYEVIVNGVNMGQIIYDASDYISKIIEVNAVNETLGHIKGEASDSYELGALMKQPVEAPVISTTMDDDYVYVDIQWPKQTDGERVYTGQYQYARGEFYYEAAVTAYVREGSQWQASPETHYVVEVPSNWKVYETPDPVVTTDLTDDQMIITAEGEGTVTLYVTIYGDPTKAVENHTATGQGSASYAIDRGNEDITISYYATALADVEGYDEILPGISRAQYDVVPKKENVVPPTPTEETAAPTFNGYTTDGIHAYFVEILETEPSTIYYRVQSPDGTWTEWAEYTEVLAFTGNGKYRVEAYAVAPGKLQSTQIAYEFVVSPITGIDEMMGNKTVASVRYFNMAGQEMQQADGMTIVVTTYTDGTTSTMKVMK